MYPDEQAVIHHVHLFQPLGIPPQLLGEQGPLLGPDLERLVPVDPVEILHDGARIRGGLVLGVLPPDRRPLEVVRLVDIPMRREQIVHNHEMDLAPSRQLHPMQPVKAREQRVRIRLDVVVVVLQDRPQELMLVVVDRLDDEAVVAREVEEGAGFARGAELGEDVFRGEGEEVVRRVEPEFLFPQLAEDPRRVVFEFEVVLCRRREFVSDAVVVIVILRWKKSARWDRPSKEARGTYMSKEYLCRAV